MNGAVEPGWMKNWAEPRRMYPHPNILTILGTYKCSAACEHCCFDSNPDVVGRLELNEITAFIAEAKANSDIQLVVFSGGECFLLGDDLVAAVKFASQLNIKTRCVTNGFWAKSKKAGHRILQELKAAGLGELNISTGDFHQKYVSEETVVNAALLGVELDLDQTLIVVEQQKNRSMTKARFLSNPKLAGCAGLPEAKFKVIESPWMPMSMDVTIEQPEEVLLNRTNVHLREGCSSLFSTLVITPHRKLGLCCGLTRERIPELNSPWIENELASSLQEAGRDFVKIWLAVDGPERILAWAASKNPAIEWENKYAHHCHACLALFKDPIVRATIRAHHKERVDDVVMRYALLLRAQQANDLSRMTAN